MVPSAVTEGLTDEQRTILLALYRTKLDPLVAYEGKGGFGSLIGGASSAILFGFALTKWKGWLQTIEPDWSPNVLILMWACVLIAVMLVGAYIGEHFAKQKQSREMQKNREDLIKFIEDCGEELFLLERVAKYEWRKPYKRLVKGLTREVIARGSI